MKRKLNFPTNATAKFDGSLCRVHENLCEQHWEKLTFAKEFPNVKTQ
jgi:hypothetical protein